MLETLSLTFVELASCDANKRQHWVPMLCCLLERRTKNSEHRSSGLHCLKMDQPTSSANRVSWVMFQPDMSNFLYSPHKMRSFINVVDVSLHSFSCIILCLYLVSFFCLCIIRSSSALFFVPFKQRACISSITSFPRSYSACCCSGSAAAMPKQYQNRWKASSLALTLSP